MPDLRNLPIKEQDALLTLNKFCFDIPYGIKRQIRNKQIGSNIAIKYSKLIISDK